MDYEITFGSSKKEIPVAQSINNNQKKKKMTSKKIHKPLMSDIKDDTTETHLFSFYKKYITIECLDNWHNECKAIDTLNTFLEINTKIICNYGGAYTTNDYFKSTDNIDAAIAWNIDIFMRKYFSVKPVTCHQCKLLTAVHIFGCCLQCLSDDKKENMMVDLTKLATIICKYGSDRLEMNMRQYRKVNCAYGSDLVYNEYLDTRRRNQKNTIKRLCDIYYVYKIEENDFDFELHGYNSKVTYNELFLCILCSTHFFDKWQLLYFSSEIIIDTNFRYDFYGKIKANYREISFAIEVDDESHTQTDVMQNDKQKNDDCAKNNVNLCRIDLTTVKCFNYDIFCAKLIGLSMFLNAICVADAPIMQVV